MPHSSVRSQENEDALVRSAKDGDESAFRALVEPLSRELSAYAYRMLGGFHDAEDALQETRLKAWNHLSTYEPHASFRAWLYRIATNTCLDMLRKEQRRVFPQDVGPSVRPGPPTTEMRTDIAWLEPYPDALLPTTPNPEAKLQLHESVRLAFIRALQLLPARQRAALVLHDVLDFSVDEIASMLESTVPAINSALQRARATLGRQAPSEREIDASSSDLLEDRKRETVARFVEAWESGNFEGLVSMLTEDAVMNMPPWVYWLDGREAVIQTMQGRGTWDGEPRPGRYRVVSTPMNGQPAGLAYVNLGDGRWIAMCLTVITLDDDGRIAAMDVFVLPKHFETWGYPSSLPA